MAQSECLSTNRNKLIKLADLQLEPVEVTETYAQAVSEGHRNQPERIPHRRRQGQGDNFTTVKSSRVCFNLEKRTILCLSVNTARRSDVTSVTTLAININFVNILQNRTLAKMSGLNKSSSSAMTSTKVRIINIISKF